VRGDPAGIAKAKRRLPSMTTKPAPISGKDRQKALRKRQAEAGLAEVRGILAPPLRHPEVKEDAAKVLRRKPKKEKV
jgi:hypothetical protein